jgi:hypothetical protein
MSEAWTDKQQVVDSDSESLIDAFFEQTKELQSEQLSLFDTQLDSSYRAALESHIEEKQEQVEQIEERLDDLIELQLSRLQKAQAQEPGLFALPGSRQKWQAQILRLQSTMQRLNNRLEAVREIKDGMGVHAPRIEELACRKLHHNEPDLAQKWGDMQEAIRRQQVMGRKETGQELGVKKKQNLSLGLFQGGH